MNRSVVRAVLVPALAFSMIAHQPRAAKAADTPVRSKTGATFRRPPDLIGAWEGKLMGKIRFIVHLDRDAAGAWKATADSPDQNATGLAVDWVTVSGDSLLFTMRQLGGEYAGQINKDHTEIAGVWKQGGASMPLVLHPQAADAEKAEATNRPQEPKPPFPYDAFEVTYPNPNAKGVTLAGTLTVPKGPGAAPCAVLITGSGPEDRDETIFGHKPFLILADYLTRHGIAVLRSDDRGVGKSTGTAVGATSDDFSSDVSAAVAFLKTRKGIDPGRIGLIGHSEGGLIAPMVATRDKSVAFVVLLAGPGVPGDSILINQSLLISRSMGFSDSLARQAQNAQRELLAAAKQSPDSAQLAGKLRVIIKAQIARMPAGERPTVVDLDEIVAGQVSLLRGSWIRFFLAYDPRPALSKLECPVLALNGEKDVQVSAEPNLREIRAALQKGGNKDITVEAMPGLNHLFQTAKTGAPSEYSKTEETFAPAALEKISDWVGSRMGRAK
jgi:pimeloyl-ACP methyl ester carboxylesterase